MPEWIQTLTVDASYSPATGITGVGIVIQERSGRSGRGPIVEQLSEGHRNISAGDGEPNRARVGPQSHSPVANGKT